MNNKRHQIERMRAWSGWVSAETGRHSTATAKQIIETADDYLAAFDKRFPAPQPHKQEQADDK